MYPSTSLTNQTLYEYVAWFSSNQPGSGTLGPCWARVGQCTLTPRGFSVHISRSLKVEGRGNLLYCAPAKRHFCGRKLYMYMHKKAYLGSRQLRYICTLKRILYSRPSWLYVYEKNIGWLLWTVRTRVSTKQINKKNLVQTKNNWNIICFAFVSVHFRS